MADRYHHGNLRAQVLAAAAEQIARDGADALSLRALAREAGVTHGAPAHHFGDRRGLLTALAAEGFELLADAMGPSVEDADFARTAVDYVAFSVGHPGHYAVMFRPDLLEGSDPVLVRERARAAAALTGGLATLPGSALRISPEHARASAWSLVHGIASLHSSGALGGQDPAVLARAAATQLFA